jgi:hypothetical protein
VLAIETVNADAYSCVEVIRSENKRHFGEDDGHGAAIDAGAEQVLLVARVAAVGRRSQPGASSWVRSRLMATVR